MANNKIELEGLPSINGGLSYAIITEKIPSFQYTDGKKAGDVPIAWRIGVALQGARYSSLTVKIEGAAEPLPEISNEAIGEACRNKVIPVSFTDLKVTLYTINGQLVKTGIATGVSIAGK